MKYLEVEHLEIGKYYHCVSYNDEDVVVQYMGNDKKNGRWWFSCNIIDADIRYVLCEKENLREERKKYE